MSETHEASFRSETYDYDLPQNRIATHPLAERDASKLLVYRQGEIAERVFRQLPDELPADTLLICNDTKVVPARLVFRRAGRSSVEVFCLQALTADNQEYLLAEQALQQTGAALYLALVGNSKRWKPQEVLVGELLQPGLAEPIRLEARWHSRTAEGIVVAFSWQPANLTFGDILNALGHTPLPPYLKRESEADDTFRYQTVYAAHPGAVAAPTAGLHFTDHVMNALAAKGIACHHLTLHVGAGTFKPLSADDIRHHEMHAEWFDAPLALITQLAEHQGPVVAVGTTATRTLESLYYIGCRVAHAPASLPEPHQLHLGQHDVYAADAPPCVSRQAAFAALAAWLVSKKANSAQGNTQLMIRPGYQYHVVKGLITNFHQPRSTLMLLVAAFVGNDWQRIYAYALGHDFRFLSYGDSSLLWRND